MTLYFQYGEPMAAGIAGGQVGVAYRALPALNRNNIRSDEGIHLDIVQLADDATFRPRHPVVNAVEGIDMKRFRGGTHEQQGIFQRDQIVG